MKLVIAIIQPTKLTAVREALEKIEVTRLTVSDAQGFGRQRGRTEMYRGHEYTTTLLRKVALEIVVNDDFLERTINTIIHVARTGPEGTIGDGKIFVLPALDAIQVSAGGRGPGAGDARIADRPSSRGGVAPRAPACAIEISPRRGQCSRPATGSPTPRDQSAGGRGAVQVGIDVLRRRGAGVDELPPGLTNARSWGRRTSAAPRRRAA